MSRFSVGAAHCVRGAGLIILLAILLISASVQADMVTMEANTDRMGADYRRIDGSPSVEACHSACLAEKECDAFTYVKSAHHCWLKRGVPGPTPNNDTISGVKKRAVGGGSCATVDGVTCEPNTDRMGADYRRIDNAPSVQFCQNQCATESKCAAYTYVKSAFHCCLKTGIPNGTSNGDAVSGVKLRGSAPATVPANESGNSRTYPDPMINGHYVDNCLNWGSNCQKPAADYFCRKNGFSGAISFELANRRPTLVMGDNKVCNEGFCVGFSRIVCGGAMAGTPADNSGSDDQRISGRYQTWQSYNFQGHYIRHRNYLGEITPISSELDSADSSFRLVPGLAGGNTVSFESKKYPGYYLRHQGFRIKLHQLDNSDLFRKDASFRVVPGLADPSWNSFESVNYPGRYLRHRDFHLYVESGNDDIFRKDSTFRSIGGNSNGADDSGTKTDKQGKESVIFYNGNDDSVSSGGRSPRFSIDRPVWITNMFTYHYGYSGTPGSIRIVSATGVEVGIWQARGRSGSPRPSYYWEITPEVVLQPGTYLVETSNPGSWSQNARSGGNGMVEIKGVYVNP